MGKVGLLDCTLRDGGYLNDWEFFHDNIVSIFERVVDAGTDFIEVGFLDDRRPYDYNRTIMPDTDSVEKVFGKLNKKNTKVIGMIDYGTCDIENIKPCNESFLDGIRVIFKKNLKKEALEFCKKIKSLGYITFAQLVSVTSYDDDELKELCELANDAMPDVVSMVDTYGLTHQKDLLHIIEILDKYLDKNIQIGYHGHNNFQMGYANCQIVLSYSKKTDRGILVDGSLYGMGKSAGNPPIELLAMHMNSEYDKKYVISQYLEAIESNILQMYGKATWGYSLFFYLAAYNDCHPSYVKQLTNKHTLSIKQINDLLKYLKGDKKLLYDKDYMEKLYVDYQNKTINDDNDIKLLTELFKNKKMLVIGPGKSVIDESQKITEYINKEKPFIVSINYASDSYEPDLIFLTNAKRHIQISTKLSLKNFTILATSNVTPMNKAFDYTVNISDLLDKDSEYPDNSLMMFLKILMKTEVKNVALAGFDGYSGTDDNYFDEGKEYTLAKIKADYLNKYMSEFITINKDKIKIEFVTTTKYKVG